MKYKRFRGRRVRKRETAYKTNGILTKHHSVPKSVHISLEICAFTESLAIMNSTIVIFRYKTNGISTKHNNIVYFRGGNHYHQQRVRISLAETKVDIVAKKKKNCPKWSKS